MKYCVKEVFQGNDLVFRRKEFYKRLKMIYQLGLEYDDE